MSFPGSDTPMGFIWCSPTRNKRQFYTNGVLARDHRSRSPQSTNKVWATNQPPITTPTGAYAFTTMNGVKFRRGYGYPLCIGDIQENNSFSGQGYRPQMRLASLPDIQRSVDEAAVYTNALSRQRWHNIMLTPPPSTRLYTPMMSSARSRLYICGSTSRRPTCRAADGRGRWQSTTAACCGSEWTV